MFTRKANSAYLRLPSSNCRRLSRGGFGRAVPEWIHTVLRDGITTKTYGSNGRIDQGKPASTSSKYLGRLP